MPTWKEITERNPQHSENYARRWKMMKEQGHDIDGEARLIDAMAERGSRILDVGCGTGRIGGYLSEHGHEVVGVDVDPVLVNHATADYPKAEWYVADIGVDPIKEDRFSLAVAAGNVMGFVDPDGREPALKHVFDALEAGGRFVVGFGAGRGWLFEDFFDLATSVGFLIDSTYSTWDLRPFDDDSTFLVAVLRKA